jgi:hypothetical protein
MSEYAPQAIQAAYNTIHHFIPQAQLSGIVGDRSHAYGYHRCRDVLPKDDYSVTQPIDRKGDGQAASALDVTLPAAQMRKVTQRLINAAKAHDVRMQTLREFFGTVNGKDVTGLDVQTLKWVSSDKSHLWHVHLSGHRAYVNDGPAWQRVAQVFCGQGSAPKAPAKPGKEKKLRRRWPSYMKKGHYFGPIAGPNTSHGGYYVAERPDIQAIQNRLAALGFGGKWTPGVYGATTTAAVTKWQKKHTPRSKHVGQVWRGDWTRLFTY